MIGFAQRCRKAEPIFPFPITAVFILTFLLAGRFWGRVVLI